MSTRVRLGILWGAILTGGIAAITGLFNLFGDHHFANSRNEYAQRGPGFRGGGFRHHELMHGVHGFHGFEFLPFLLIGLAVLVLIVRWYKKKSKASSMQQFIDTSFVNSQVPVANNNASILDQWEDNLLTKKENK